MIYILGLPKSLHMTGMKNFGYKSVQLSKDLLVVQPLGGLLTSMTVVMCL